MQRNISGNVKELYISISEEPFRVSQTEIAVDVNGVLGDKFYAKDPSRAILVTSMNAYLIANNINIDLKNGLLGENILIEGSIKGLQLGERFFIGDVEFELAQNCTLCKGLSKIDSQLPQLLKDDRGIFIKAITNGTIKVGDSLHSN
jgi:MOSC domain-containing protein YiiM